MKFSSPALVVQTCWDMMIADQLRGSNRALIARLFNGLPPWTESEKTANWVKTNVNWLEAPRLAADARRSYYNAFLKPGSFFNVELDYGPPHKRKAWGSIITRELNRMMKGSPRYFEFLRSQFALTVLYGVGPGFWFDHETWCPRCLGVEDVFIPSNTLLTMENLSHFALRRSWTAREIWEATHQLKVDPAWNMDMVNAALKWVHKQTQQQLPTYEWWAPEKFEEQHKENPGFWGTDSVPTIDTWDFYFWSDENGQQGWRRRMVLDTPGDYELVTDSHGRLVSSAPRAAPNKNRIGESQDHWLYCPNDNRIYASKLGEILHFQFGDATATAPFRYHSVRSLGWLLYAVCHLQNRLRSKVNDAVFESLLQYFRTSNPEDKERITEIDLHNLGVVPEGLAFVKQDERWKVDGNLVTMGLQQNQQMMTESAAQYREGRNQGPSTKEKTATEIMAEVNSSNALVGAMLLQAYMYHRFQGMEIARRACIKNSSDADVRSFRVNVLKAGVPEDALESSTWNIEPERVLGNGNKTLEVAMADKLMAARQLHDPESQREILYLYDVANSDDPALADRLVPLDKARVSDSVHDAQMSMGSLMLGMPVPPVKGQNPIEMIETLLAGMAVILQKTVQGGLPPKMEELAGLQNVARTVGQYIAMLAEDKNEKQRVKQYEDELGKFMKLIEQFAKQVQQQAPAAGGNGAPQPDPKEMAKAQAIQMQAQVKAQAAAQSHAQRTTQREVQFNMKQRQDAERHQADLKKRLAETKLAAAATDIKTAAEIKKNRLKALQQ